MSNAESRQHRRHAVPTRCIARSAEDGRLLADRTIDLSYSGARLAALGPATVGERVRLSIELPLSRVWVHGEARVERVIAGARAQDTCPALGLRIETMDPARRALMAQVASDYPESGRFPGARRADPRAIGRIELTRRGR